MLVPEHVAIVMVSN